MPRAVQFGNLHVGGRDDFLERVRPGFQAHVGHPHHRQPGPAVGPYAPAVVQAGDGGRVPAGEHADPPALAHRVPPYGGEPSSSKPKLPSAPGVVGSITMFISSEP